MSTSTKSRWWRRLPGSIILAVLLATAALVMASGMAQVHAAALAHDRVFAGASGSGKNAPPPGTQPLRPGLWDAKDYRIPHHFAACPQPPQSAQARYALANSPIALQEYGLLLPSQVGNDMVKWRAIVAHAVMRHCDFATPVFNGHYLIASNINYNDSWSGFGNLCNPTPCNHYYSADFKMSVPSIDRSPDFREVSTWVGVGGANQDTLSQTGVDEWSFLYANTEDAFFESVQCGTVSNAEQYAYAVNTGDSMYFYTNADGIDNLYDYTTNNYTNESWGCGNTASIEFIQERIWYGQPRQADPLANFHSLVFHNAEWYDLGYVEHGLYDTYGGGGIYQWVLQSYGNDMIDMSWPVSDSGYGNTWTAWFKRGT